jgi:hypothetical protein
VLVEFVVWRIGVLLNYFYFGWFGAFTAGSWGYDRYLACLCGWMNTRGLYCAFEDDILLVCGVILGSGRKGKGGATRGNLYRYERFQRELAIAEQSIKLT